LLPLFALAGCSGTILDNMTHALSVSNDALALSLLASESAAWIDATTSPSSTTPTTGTTATDTGLPPGARHGPAGDCPKITREPEVGAPFTVFGDYRTGCVSGSGLVPAVLSGSVQIDSDTTHFIADYGALDVALARTMAGQLDGTYTDPEHVAMVGEIALPKSQDRAALSGLLDLQIVFEPSRVHLDGTVTTGGQVVVFDGVILDQSMISGDCPRPDAGTATIPGAPEVVVDYGEPSGTEVTVLQRNRRSQPTNPCIWESRAF
jgi:hypothetical protein